MIALDTNVLSELLRPTPAPQVEAWLAAQDGKSVYFTCVREANVRHGVAILPVVCSRDALAQAIESILEEDFRDRILPFDRKADRAYAAIAAERCVVCRPTSQFDCQIAAITRGQGACMVTRNVGDHEGCGIDVLNPWPNSIPKGQR